jgi:hypothetical protein
VVETIRVSGGFVGGEGRPVIAGGPW